jgi:SAM-dependent methyltransferase
MYADLAPWFHLLTAPEDYAEEAAHVADLLEAAAEGPVRTLLELGSGGGNTASHLRDRFELTLTDRSPEMLALSATINPGVEHVVGDMRTLRLGRTFDAVLVHDAIVYMTTPADLRAALETVVAHLRPGGATVLMPDDLRETFAPSTDHGGHDAPDGRGLRYLEWSTDPDPDDTTCVTDFVIVIRDADGSIRVEHDRHEEGLFGRDEWLALLAEVGLVARAETDPWGRVVLVGIRPAGSGWTGIGSSGPSVA